VPLLVINRADVIGPREQSGDWQPFAGVADVLAQLSNSGFTVLLINNEPMQAAASEESELLNLEALEAANLRINEMVENRGGTIAGSFYYPRVDSDGETRIPKTVLIDAIELEFATPANEMILVGNGLDDITLAQAVGAQAVLVSHDQPLDTPDDVTRFERFAAAGEYLLRHY
jgi:D-glycero-D-manno-heptose 1,7-bisphosphate phosphatase